MGLTGSVAKHPAQYSPEILTKIDEMLRPGPARVHDPFAGLGRRLGELCDRRRIGFTGCDIEDWPNKDPRVIIGDSTSASTYPSTEFVVVTSPVYFGNRISSDYVNGPTEKTKKAGRRAYGISLGRPLATANAARVCKPNQLDEYLELHARAMRHWQTHAIVNVDSPMMNHWFDLLAAEGFKIVNTIAVRTQRYKIAGHGDKRAPYEVVIQARRANRQVGDGS